MRIELARLSKLPFFRWTMVVVVRTERRIEGGSVASRISEQQKASSSAYARLLLVVVAPRRATLFLPLPPRNQRQAGIRSTALLLQLSARRHILPPRHFLRSVRGTGTSARLRVYQPPLHASWHRACGRRSPSSWRCKSLAHRFSLPSLLSPLFRSDPLAIHSSFGRNGWLPTVFPPAAGI